MKKNETWFTVGFAVLAVLVFAGAVVIKGRLAMAPNAGVDTAQTPVPDTVAVASSSADGDEIVADATANYYFSMPTNWYVEKNAGAGLTVYPDYDPNGGEAPDCKIEISAFANANLSNANSDGTDLNAWITSELHADPTADVMEISRTPIAVGSSSAIEWQGALNNVTTTLVYIARPENILELAPSTLSGTSNADNDDCDLDLQALVANLQFGAYEP